MKDPKTKLGTNLDVWPLVVSWFVFAVCAVLLVAVAFALAALL